MTTDLAAPELTRPPHINRHWWYRATWHARQAAVDTHNKQIRENADAIRAEAVRIAELRATVERERRAHDKRYHPGELDDAEPLEDDALNTAAIIETIDSMLDWTDDVAYICRELGKSAGALEMRMRRADPPRPDLARMFMQVRNASRYKPCPDCGRRTSIRSARCRPCAFRAREVKVA